MMSRFAAPLSEMSVRTMEITRLIGAFIAAIFCLFEEISFLLLYLMILNLFQYFSFVLLFIDMKCISVSEKSIFCFI